MSTLQWLSSKFREIKHLKLATQSGNPRPQNAQNLSSIVVVVIAHEARSVRGETVGLEYEGVLP